MCNLHWCYTWTALLSANQNRVIFSCILLTELSDRARFSVFLSNPALVWYFNAHEWKVAFIESDSVCCNVLDFILTKRFILSLSLLGNAKPASLIKLSVTCYLSFPCSVSDSISRLELSLALVSVFLLSVVLKLPFIFLLVAHDSNMYYLHCWLKCSFCICYLQVPYIWNSRNKNSHE